MLIAVLSAFLVGAVICDVASHRLPNWYLLLGLLVGLGMQVWMVGWFGLRIGLEGLLAGFAVFIPFYVLKGMAAGDVKLMAVVGGFLDWQAVLWAAGYSLVAGSVLGVLYLLSKGQLGRLISRYCAMAVTRTRIFAEEGDASRHRFPYSIAIAVGTIVSLYWAPNVYWR